MTWLRVVFWSALAAAPVWLADLVPSVILRHWDLAGRDSAAFVLSALLAYVSRELLHSGTSR